MSICTCLDSVFSGLEVVTQASPPESQKERLREALAPLDDRCPLVDGETLLRYYQYLAPRLTFPCTAVYPKATNRHEEILHRCVVLELLDPSKHFTDEFDGLCCRVQKGKYEVILPLVELEVPRESPNAQLIEDYWHWFWNWR